MESLPLRSKARLVGANRPPPSGFRKHGAAAAVATGQVAALCGACLNRSRRPAHCTWRSGRRLLWLALSARSPSLLLGSSCRAGYTCMALGGRTDGAALLVLAPRAGLRRAAARQGMGLLCCKWQCKGVGALAAAGKRRASHMHGPRARRLAQQPPSALCSACIATGRSVLLCKGPWSGPFTPAHHVPLRGPPSDRPTLPGSALPQWKQAEVRGRCGWTTTPACCQRRVQAARLRRGGGAAGAGAADGKLIWGGACRSCWPCCAVLTAR